ncbi:MAG: hypothetical protein OJF49_001470 [Ktedonobacterales bacterium]|jgi:sporulation protein YlmC with PRC-barrel domain|nr:MAG: hypothetical protein OJF49_001470 [Ktedonobacterales bacterium]
MDTRAPEAQQSTADQHNWRASLLLRRLIVDLRTIESIGEVADVVFDPVSCRLAAVGLAARDTESATSPVVTMARRMFGGVHTLTYISVERIIALNGDVVTVDTEAPHPGNLQHVDRLPHLSQTRDLPVITLRGRRLGKLVDLLLDSDGGRITGYLIKPTRFATPLTNAYEEPVSASEDDEDHRTEGQDGPAAPELAPSKLRVIPASPQIRVGRALIIVFEDEGYTFGSTGLIGREQQTDLPALDGGGASGDVAGWYASDGGSADGRADHQPEQTLH